MEEKRSGTADPGQDTVAKKSRLLSLDFYRGLTVGAMILVNTPGDWNHIYPPLEHSKWNGCTPTDLIFPSFLFMVGVSIVYSMQKKKSEIADHRKILLNTFRRMIILIIIGLAIQLFYRPDFAHLRFPGVLQRIGVVYFITTILYLKTSQQTQTLIFCILLISYYCILSFLPVPDGHAPNLDPVNNIGAWLDRAIFSTDHLSRITKAWDPVGLLSTLPAIGTALFGLRVGSLLKRTDLEVNVKCVWLFVIGITAILLGLIVDLFFPINKALWTSSYVLYSGGICTLGLTLAYWFIDVKGYQKNIWPFLVFGTNAISAYMLSEIMPGIINFVKFTDDGQRFSGMGYFYHCFLLPYFSAVNASLIFAICFTIFIWLIMYLLYLKKVFIKI